MVRCVDGQVCAYACGPHMWMNKCGLRDLVLSRALRPSGHMESGSALTTSPKHIMSARFLSDLQGEAVIGVHGTWVAAN